MRRLQNNRGQLFMPMACVVLLLALLLIGYTQWCRAVYWQMRMDLAAEAVALSAARAQAGQLNNVAVLQSAENAFIQKAKVFKQDYAHMQVEVLEQFQQSNEALNAALRGFNGFTGLCANKVAKLNGGELAPLSYPKPGHHLEGQKVNVFCFAELIPCGEFPFPNAYYRRAWGEGIRKAQPDHIVTWAVRSHGLIGVATGRVWLDVSSGDLANNGGFPAKGLAWYRDVGIQCFYPNFTARLAPTPVLSKTILRQLLGQQ